MTAMISCSNCGLLNRLHDGAKGRKRRCKRCKCSLLTTIQVRWHITNLDGNDPQGPFVFTELMQLVEDGLITEHTLLSCVEDKWISADEVPGLLVKGKKVPVLQPEPERIHCPDCLGVQEVPDDQIGDIFCETCSVNIREAKRDSLVRRAERLRLVRPVAREAEVVKYEPKREPKASNGGWVIGATLAVLLVYGMIRSELVLRLILFPLMIIALIGAATIVGSLNSAAKKASKSWCTLLALMILIGFLIWGRKFPSDNVGSNQWLLYSGHENSAPTATAIQDEAARRNQLEAAATQQHIKEAVKEVLIREEQRRQRGY